MAKKASKPKEAKKSQKLKSSLRIGSKFYNKGTVITEEIQAEWDNFTTKDLSKYCD